jgi:hypothetical protein
LIIEDAAPEAAPAGKFSCPVAQTSVGESDSTSGCSQRRSAFEPDESQVWIAALMRTSSDSENSNSFAAIERVGFHTTLSWPASISHFISSAFASSSSSAILS